MTKCNIKRRHSKTLDLSLQNINKSFAGNIFDGEHNFGAVTPVNNYVSNFVDINKLNPEQAKLAGFTPTNNNLATSSFSNPKSGFDASNFIGKAGNVVSGVTSIIDSSLKNAKIADTTGIENNIEDFRNTDFSEATDSNSLLNAYNNLNFLKDDYSWKDVRGVSNSELFGNTLSAVGSGAMAGASVGGPWGAVAGAAIGLGGSLAGIFTGKNKAKRKARFLNQASKVANNTAIDNYDFQVDNVMQDNARNAMKYAYAAEGGPINIKKENRGKFTESANRAGMGVQEYARHILANKDKYSSTLVKRANFARNAAGWKHAEGGPIKNMSFEDWYKTVPTDRNDTTAYNLRRAYELAPFDELEAWRTSSVKDLNSGKNHLRSVYLNPDTGIYEFMKSKNHPTLHFETDWYNSNDPEAIKFRNNYNLDMNGDYYKYVPKKKAFGGELNTHGGDFSNGVTFINNGGTHEQNPFEGVPMGVAPDGKPNLVEEGEVLYNDYVFSNRLYPTDKELKEYNLPKKYKGHTFALIAEDMSKESAERPNDPISKRGLEASLGKLASLQEEQRMKKGKTGTQQMMAFGGRKFAGTKNTYSRYAPAVGSAIGAATSLLSKPDYTPSDAVLEAANQMGNYTPISYNPIGNYLSYNPFDRNYYTNKLNAQAGAIRRAIMNTSNPSRNAALLAADYNAQGKLGDLARQAEEYNLAQRQAVEQFNRGTNQANAEMGLKAAMANQGAALKAGSSRLSGIAQAMQMRDAIDNRRSASISSNLTNLFNNLGNIGKEEYTMDMIRKNPFLLYDWLDNYKGPKANGGYLTIKKKSRRK